MGAPVLLPAGSATSAGSVKRHLEDLLRSRRLCKQTPPLCEEDRGLRPLGTGVSALDAILEGGFPRGQLSELHGPTSSGRTGILLALVARVTRSLGLVALVDPLDRLDPLSAAAAGVDLTRLLWLRGPRGAGEEPSTKPLAAASTAVATLAGSGLFELVILDVAGAGHASRSLPATTWLRLQRLVEGAPTAIVVVASGHLARGPGGFSLAFEASSPRWSAPPGPSRLLEALHTRARSGRHGMREAELVLAAVA